MRAFLLALMVAATMAGQVKAAAITIDFRVENSLAQVLALGTFQFDSAKDGTVLDYSDLSSFQFSVPVSGSGENYDLAFLNSGSFNVFYGMAFDTSTDRFQTLHIADEKVLLAAIKTNRWTGFIITADKSEVRDYIQGGENIYSSIIVQRSSLASVPEPSSLAVFAIGACAAGAFSGRRRQTIRSRTA